MYIISPLNNFLFDSSIAMIWKKYSILFIIPTKLALTVS